MENGEGMQILHYVDGQKYEAHHDFFHDKYNALPSNGGQRIATVLMYLYAPLPTCQMIWDGGDAVLDVQSASAWLRCQTLLRLWMGISDAALVIDAMLCGRSAVGNAEQ